ncbi:MAG: heavy metal translocating P-type ATPase [Candidatus Helarchaeota archaeon]
MPGSDEKEEKKLRLDLGGMTCATCALKIEKQLNLQPGVSNATVNFGLESAYVKYNPKRIQPTELIKAVKDIGYKANLSRIELQVEGITNDKQANKIKNEVSMLTGINNVYVNYKSGMVHVEYNSEEVTPKEIMNSIKKLSFNVHETVSAQDKHELERQKEIKDYKRRFILSLILALPVMIFSWLHLIPLLSKGILLIFGGSPFIFRLFLFILSTPVQFYAGSIFYRGAFLSLKNKSANMDVLVVLGTTTAYFYSIYTLILALIKFLAPTTQIFIGNSFFEASTMITMFILLGKYLEAFAKGKSSEAIKKLMGLQPNTAIVVRDSHEIEVPINEVEVGDIILVKAGSKIPVDGVIIEGKTRIDESMITGESFPVLKSINDQVIGGTLNKSGLIKFKTSKIGKDTVLSRIIKLVEDAQSEKAPIQRLADKVANIFVPIVIGIATLTLIYWIVIGSFIYPMITFEWALLAFTSVVVIACPCAMGLAIPTAMLVGSGKGAEIGILIKGGESLETVHKIQNIVFDKTGTLTKGEPEVTDIFVLNKEENKMLQLAASVEKGSEHPLAEAIIKKAKEKGIELFEPKDFEDLSGFGVKANVNGEIVMLGNERLMKMNSIDIKSVNEKLKDFQNEGKTVVILTRSEQVMGLIAIADPLKDNSIEAIEKLKELGIEISLLTGDNEKTARAIANKLNIDRVFSEVLPADKSNEIKKLQEEGNVVAMVGDGINDAPALAQADVGIAMGSGTDVAIETGDIILMRNDLRNVVAAINLSRKTVQKMKINLLWAFLYNSVGIPIAAGVLVPLFLSMTNSLVFLPPGFAALAMAMSSVSVVSNSLLLKRYEPRLRSQVQEEKEFLQKTEIDPVCGMKVVPGVDIEIEHEGKKYYFCNPNCRVEFEKNPEKYLSRKQEYLDMKEIKEFEVDFEVPELICEKCGESMDVPQHCGKPMHVENVNGKDMLVCWMGPNCGKQEIPTHHGIPMKYKK